MARDKKEEAPAPGAPAWMASFADLMNLLLCFFVLLFAMSNTDEVKVAELAASFNNAFSIFSGGSQAIGDGKLISQGMSQMDYFSEYYSEMGLEAGKDSNEGEKSEQGEDQTAGENSEVGQDGEQVIGENPEVGENGEKVDTGQQQQGENGEKVDTGQQQQGESGDTAEKNAIEEYIKSEKEKQRQITEEVYDNLIAASEEKQIADSLEISMEANYQYVQINLSGAILFDSGKDEIKKEALPILSKVGDILMTYDKYIIKIEGHTDNVPVSRGKYASNMWLSTARATKVFEYLTGEKGMDPKTLEASGRGEYEPIASNKDVAGRAKNRRVEIKIYTNIKK